LSAYSGFNWRYDVLTWLIHALTGAVCCRRALALLKQVRIIGIPWILLALRRADVVDPRPVGRCVLSARTVGLLKEALRMVVAAAYNGATLF